MRWEFNLFGQILVVFWVKPFEDREQALKEKESKIYIPWFVVTALMFLPA